MRHNQKLRQFHSMCSDSILIFLAYFAAITIRFEWLAGIVSIPLWSTHFVVTALLYSFFITVVFSSLHLYSNDTHNKISNYLMISIANGIGIVGLMALLYFFRIVDFSRLALIIFWIISTGLVIIKHYLVTLIIRHAQKHGKSLRHIIVVGSGSLAEMYIRDLQNTPGSGCIIIGSIGSSSCHGCSFLGKYEQIEQILIHQAVDEIVVALSPDEANQIQHVLEAAGHEGLRITLVPIFSEFIPASPTVRTVGSTAVINMRSTRLDHPGWSMLKRCIDIIGSVILIVVFAPLMIFIALGVRLSSPGPVLFRQKRIGLNRKPFYMLKFRSMQVNSCSDTAWSSAVDPRKTHFGSFIRRYSLDELPQLFNVLKGEMSLVGPRPEIPYHVERFKQNIPLYLVRQQIRPGMTGWAQVNGLRGDTSIQDRVKYDIWYIENWSLWLDIKILLKTAFGGMVNHAETKQGE